MREIVLDTETTGLDPAEGHRVVEIGAVELHNHLCTGRHFHVYINPQRPMPQEAERIHGLGDAFLADKPVFAAIVEGFLDFIGDAPLVIHNAAFDMKMLNAELARLSRPRMPDDRAIDTVALARRKFPGAQASLDALCKRFGIDNGARTLHGALLDSELLAEVYLELLGGRQQGFMLERATEVAVQATPEAGARQQRPRPLGPRLTPAEADAHAAFVDGLGEGALWRRWQTAVDAADQ